MKIILIPDEISGPGKYRYSDPVPVNVYIGGHKAENPRVGIKVGMPFFPDEVSPHVSLQIGEYFDESDGKEAVVHGSPQD